MTDKTKNIILITISVVCLLLLGGFISVCGSLSDLREIRSIQKTSQKLDDTIKERSDLRNVYDGQIKELEQKKLELNQLNEQDRAKKSENDLLLANTVGLVAE